MIIYKTGTESIVADDLEDFFEGWGKKPDPEKRLKILQNSDHIITAHDEGRLIGFINAITDKTLSAYIPLLEVLPAYRGKGIGGELVKRMTELLSSFYMIDLCCDDDLSGFYEKLGFNKSVGMIKRNYDKI